MLNQSVKEYELIKKEVQIIKDCITKYISYIIGSNGIAFLIYGSIKSNTPNSSSISVNIPNIVNILSADVVLSIEIIIITAIYYLINYKFKSHNRHVGYLQLLSQEINNEFKTELDNSLNEHTQKHIFAWEYVNAKWNNRVKHKVYPKYQFSKLNLGLQIPALSSQGVKTVPNDEVVNLFFENIIWKFFNGSNEKSLYKKFRVKSWTYPRHIFNLSFILILVSWLLMVLLMDNPKLSFTQIIPLSTECFEEELPNVSQSELTCLSLNSFIFCEQCYIYFFNILVLIFSIIIWCFFYRDLRRILFKDQTIDFYCWAFLSHRTRLLNNYNIVPVYHSSLFHRYYKSIMLIKKIKELPKDFTIHQKLIDLTELEEMCNLITKGFQLSNKQRKIIKQLKDQLS